MYLLRVKNILSLKKKRNFNALHRFKQISINPQLVLSKTKYK